MDNTSVFGFFPLNMLGTMAHTFGLGIQEAQAGKSL